MHLERVLVCIATPHCLAGYVQSIQPQPILILPQLKQWGSKIHLPSPGRQPQFVCTYARHLGQVQGTGQMSLRTFASQSNLCCYSCRYLKESNVSRHFFLSTFVPETLEFINRKDEYKSRWIRVVESMICHLTDSGFFTYKLRLWQY